jgi:uncharacterized coiled-coil DUF342 family protein
MKIVRVGDKTRMRRARTLAKSPPDVRALGVRVNEDYQKAEELATKIEELRKKVHELRDAMRRLEASRPKSIPQHVWQLLKMLKRQVLP